MGLFGSKKKTYRDFSYARMIEDDYLPDVIGQAVTTYVLGQGGDKSLTDLMLEYGWKSNAVKWDAAYRYAKKPSKYAYGLPHSASINQTDFTEATDLDTMLKQLTGQQNLQYSYSHFGVNNFRHSMWQLLVSQQAYSPTANRLDDLSQQIGVDVYLQDAKNFITDKATLNGVDYMFDHWGFSPTSGKTQSRTQDLNRADTVDGVSTTDNYVRVEYTFRAAGVTDTTTKETTKVTTTIRTPDGNGGYTETSSDTSSDTTNTVRGNGNATLPTSGLVSETPGIKTTTSKDETDTPTETSVTDPTTGVITVTKTEVSRHITTDTFNVDYVYFFNMGFGVYDFTGDFKLVDTNTVLDDDDNPDNDPTVIDPNAVLKPSGEDTQADDDFFQVCYFWNDATGLHIGYFTYQYGSGTYPDLDGISSADMTGLGACYPRIYFRLDGNKLNESRYVNTAAYKTSMKLCRKLDMQWSEVLEKVYSGIGSLSKVRDILMIECVPANTTNRIEQEYLFKYFHQFWKYRAAVNQGANPPASSYTGFDVRQGATVKSSDGTFNTYNALASVGYREVNGSIGAVGHCESGHANGTRVVSQVTTETDDQGHTTSKVTWVARSTQYHYYRMQIDATTYGEVRVFELSHSVDVGGHGKGADGTDEKVMVPLDYALHKEFSPHERETLYARACHLIICTEYTVKKKWYQSGIFKVVVTVVAVVLAWWTGGASLTLIGALTAVATAVGMQIAFALLSKYVFSKLGGAFAIIAMVVAVVVAVYTGYVAFSGTTGPFSLTASQLMQASNVAFKAAESAQQGVIADEMQKMATLQGQMEEGNRQLEAAEHELHGGVSNSFDNMALMNRMSGYTMLGEKPEDYYHRTLNTNIGIAALALPDIYLTTALTPPTNVSIFMQMQQNMSQPFELNESLFNFGQETNNG